MKKFLSLFLCSLCFAENIDELYELYNLLGQKIEDINLPSGIYIKKYKNKTIKIIK